MKDKDLKTTAGKDHNRLVISILGDHNNEILQLLASMMKCFIKYTMVCLNFISFIGPLSEVEISAMIKDLF